MRIERRIHLSAEPQRVWEILSDTDRLNREVGLPPIHFDFIPRPIGGTEVTATVRVSGVTLHYREHPFEWVRPLWYNVRRTFFGGPIKEIWAGVELTENNTGTDVLVFAELEPNGPVGRPICSALGRKSVADMAAGCRRIEEYFTTVRPAPFVKDAGPPPANHERLEAAFQGLLKSGADDAISRRLLELIAQAPPKDVSEIRPFELADRWGMQRKAVLAACLSATRRGMLDLRWRLLCPFCRGSRQTLRTLDEVKAEAHCETCNIRFDAEFDRSVEVVFSVAPAIRPVHVTTYCIGGPKISPHAAAQFVLQPNSERSAEFPGLHGTLELATLQAGGRASIDSVDGHVFTVEIAGSPPAICVRQSDTDGWTFSNRLAEDVVIRLESPEWRDDIATAAYVTSLPAFRDQFSSEALSPDTELAVRQICILFSDLVGSTEMYRRLGDAPSYRTVRDHFDSVRAILDAHDGSVVKTAGDAVMACFYDPADALAAAVTIQREAMSDPSGLRVRLGLHWGPALVVNANDHLDYFGHTVNMASRLQHHSLGGDVVLAAEVTGDPRLAELLKQPGIACETFSVDVRGVDEPVQMVRVTIRED